MKNHVIAIINDLANNIENKAVKIIKDQKIVAWGKLMRAIKTKVDPENLTIDVFADHDIAPYAQYVHEGREPGKMPPVRPIEEWLRKKRIPVSPDASKVKLSVRVNQRAMLSNEQAKLQEKYRSVAWAIATKIKKEGMKPKRFLISAIIESINDMQHKKN